MTTTELTPIHNVLGPVTAEQREHAIELAGAMAKKFSVDSRDFSIVQSTDKNESPDLVVVYASEWGLPLGSWEDIQAEPEKGYTIEVADRIIDTREGMTEGVYFAMISQVRDQCRVLPDRKIVHSYFGRVSLDGRTWLTGESRGDFVAPYGSVNLVTDKAMILETQADDQSPRYSFRPTAPIE
jgi:hypothetical protein